MPSLPRMSSHHGQRTLAAILIRLVPVFAAVACDPEGLGRSNPDFLVIGHRGAPNEAAENTLPALEVAVSLGANAVEVDLCVTRDDVLVIWHDRDPDSTVALVRQSGGEGLLYVPAVPPVGSAWRRPVSELTLAELRENYGYAHFGEARDESVAIPTFEEFLTWARGESKLEAAYLDLKVTAAEVSHALPLVEGLAADAELGHVDFYLMSVLSDVVTPLEEERVRLGVDRPRVVWDFEGPGALQATIDAGLRDVMSGLVPDATWHDFKAEVAEFVDARERAEVDSVTVWTFDREQQLADLLYYSVDGIMTNEPALLYRMWQDTLEPSPE
jgi:glycerophosphoryl diester phosphodiesterase